MHIHFFQITFFIHFLKFCLNLPYAILSNFMVCCWSVLAAVWHILFVAAFLGVCLSACRDVYWQWSYHQQHSIKTDFRCAMGFLFLCSPFPERRFSSVATIKKIYVSKRFLSRDKLNIYFRWTKFKLSGFQYATN